jgi:hypothetical protein
VQTNEDRTEIGYVPGGDHDTRKNFQVFRSDKRGRKKSFKSEDEEENVDSVSDSQ